MTGPPTNATVLNTTVLSNVAQVGLVLYRTETLTAVVDEEIEDVG